MNTRPASGSIGVSILGATGSVGVSTLDVLARHRDRFHVVGLSAHTNTAQLFAQCMAHQPLYAVMADPDCAQDLDTRLRAAGSDTQVLSGVQGLEQIAVMEQTDYVMAAIVGAAGLLPTLAAAGAGKRVLLANKEALVMSGQLFIDRIKTSGAQLLPIDSEHNAVFQCMPVDFSQGLSERGVEKILLTASGGPFRDMAYELLDTVTPEQACAHPNWDMGRKISVDSATMMNKGLEVIEACWLFDTPCTGIEVVLHPQSIVHSLVAYNDGSVLAQLGNPDMRTPIAHALAWPQRIDSGVAPLDLFQIAQLDFKPPDAQRFPCLRLAYEAFECGGTATTVLNAANEVAVEAFLQGQIRFTDIVRIISDALERMSTQEATTLEVILEADAQTRRIAAQSIQTANRQRVSL